MRRSSGGRGARAAVLFAIALLASGLVLPLAACQEVAVSSITDLDAARALGVEPPPGAADVRVHSEGALDRAALVSFTSPAVEAEAWATARLGAPPRPGVDPHLPALDLDGWSGAFGASDAGGTLTDPATGRTINLVLSPARGGWRRVRVEAFTR